VTDDRQRAREELALLIERMCPNKPESNFGHPVGTECEALADAILLAFATPPEAGVEIPADDALQAPDKIWHDAREIAVKFALPGHYDGITSYATMQGDADNKDYMGALRFALTSSNRAANLNDGEALARRFHEIYERRAPEFGYETRTETRQFDPTTPNGQLMITVCSEIAAALSTPTPDGGGRRSVAAPTPIQKSQADGSTPAARPDAEEGITIQSPQDNLATPARPDSLRMLGELLAVIHRDGGLYQDEHGLEKAVADAMRLSSERIAAARPDEPFQARVRPWLLACFGEMIAGDREERNHRFLEEALELVQACGCTAHEAHQLVDYVYGRDVGEPAQEVGGVMVTLAALCLANDLDMHANGETELARIWTKVEAIRAKQAAKPKHSPLPGQTASLPDTTETDR